MKIQLNSEKKTVAILEDCPISELFNTLMKWFPEDWENWTFTKTVVDVAPIVIEKPIWVNPYWSPYRPYYYNAVGNDTSDKIDNPYFTQSSITTLKIN